MRSPPPRASWSARPTGRAGRGEESVKDRFTLPEEKMVPFLTGEYNTEQARQDISAKVGCSSACRVGWLASRGRLSVLEMVLLVESASGRCLAGD